MIQGNDYSHAHLLSAGIKIFTRQDSRTNPADNYCKWRIPSDGLATMLPYLHAGALVHAEVDDLRMLLEEQYPIVSIDPPWPNRSTAHPDVDMYRLRRVIPVSRERCGIGLKGVTLSPLPLMMARTAEERESQNSSCARFVLIDMLG